MSAGRAPGRSQAGPHPLGGSADVPGGRGADIHSHLSSTWAVRTALRLRGLDDLPDALIFGLGASAWYRLEAPREPGGGAVLRALHPDRIKQSFFALNVYAVRFNYLSRDVLAQLRERCSLGVQTLISVDRFALPDAPAAAGCSLDYTLLVHADASNAPGFRVQGPHDAEPRHLSDEALQAAWFYRHGQAATASFYWHPVLALKWDEAAAIARALRCHAAQMRHRFASLGETGLRALERLLVLLDAGDSRPLAAAARCAMADGGPALGRDLMAEFLRHAASRLGAAPLKRAAAHFDACAGLWRAVVPAFAGGSTSLMGPPRAAFGLTRSRRSTLAFARSTVAEVLRHERAALAAIDSIDIGAPACAA
jgi:hypothetical protein